MALRNFKYYTHSQSFHEYWEDSFLIDQLKLEEDGWTEEQIEELGRKIGEPFYEVTHECTLDDETGEVTLISSRL